MSVIDRPETSFDGASHTYGLEGWADEDVVGVSSAAKVGGFDDTWGVASAWGFRIGYEGTHALATEHNALSPFDVEIITKEGPKIVRVETQDDLREAMKGRGLTPWSKRDKAAERGSWVHDILELLGQHNRIPTPQEIAQYTPEAQGHIRSLLAWYVWLRPEFVATEVQVASRTHGFAGRYDIRALVDAWRLVPLLEPPLCPIYRTDPQAERIRFLASIGEKALGLLDLKTSKGIFPTTHFPQLEGYEGAGVEMGFHATDFRAVINTRPDGTFEPVQLGISWATYDMFLLCVQVYRSVRQLKAQDPENLQRKARESAILSALPARSRDLAVDLPELAGLDALAVGRILSRMKKRDLVRQAGQGIWEAV